MGLYLMTLYAPVAEAHNVDDRLRVVNHPDGWVEGPQIKGKIIPPSSDTLRNMGNGVNWLDVRLTIQTDDDQIIYVSYNGINHCSKEVRDRFLSGETLHTGDCYFITARRSRPNRSDTVFNCWTRNGDYPMTPAKRCPQRRRRSAIRRSDRLPSQPAFRARDCSRRGSR
jgi:Protein of unknown function (DUF3237)